MAENIKQEEKAEKSEENSSGVVASDSVLQKEEKNWNGEVPHLVCIDSLNDFEPEENWDDDGLPSNYVIPSWTLNSEDFYGANLQQQETDESFLLDKPFMNSCKMNSVASEGPSEGRFSDAERFRKKKRRQKFTYEYDTKTIFVRNVNFKTSVKILWNFFDTFGKVKHCHLLLDSQGRSTGRAVVTFCCEETAKLVLNTSEEKLSLHGRMLSVFVHRRKVYESDGVSAKKTNGKETSAENSKETEAAISNADYYDINRPTPIMQLNEEMIAHILTFLSLKERLLAERICKRFRSVSVNYWSSIKQLKIESSAFSPRVFEDRDLKLLLNRGSQALSSITLSSSRLTDRSLRAIAQNCKGLKELFLLYGNFTNNGLRIVADGCHHLQSFRIQSSVHRIGEKGLWWIFHRCKKLKYVDVIGVKNLKGQCLHVLGPEVVRLNVTNCSELTDIGIQKVRSACSQIRELSVANCYHLRDVSLFTIGQCSTLTSLNISGLVVTEFALKELRHLKHLEHLFAADIPKVDDELLEAISRACPQLRTLDIANHGVITSASNVTDNGINSVATGCLLLSSLNVSNHRMISDLSLKSISELESMRDVYLSHCEGVTDEGVVCLVTQRPTLRVLSVAGCLNVGNLSLMAAMARAEKHSGSLTLTLTGTSVDPAKIPKNLPNLEIIYFQEPEYEDTFQYVVDNGDAYGYDDDDDDDLEYEFFPVTTDVDYDEFLETDDPLESERWEMS